MMDVLVTGSQGFIGQHLIKALKLDNRIKTIVGISRTEGDRLYKASIANGSREVLLNADITKPGEMQYLLSAFRPKVIFHLAANPLTKLDELNPTGITINNVIGTQNLLHYAQNHPRFVFASSVTVYGDAHHPAKENEALTPTSVYGATKVACEAMVHAYTKMERVSGISLRYVANVGKGATHGVLPDVVRKLRSDNPILELFGNDPGTQKPYMHVDDTVRATLYFGLDSCYQSPINIAPLNSITIKTLAQTVMLALDLKKPMHWLGAKTIWAGDNYVVKVDNSKMEKLEYTYKYKTSEQAITAATREL